MGLAEEIGKLSILYFVIPLVIFVIWYLKKRYFKKKKKRIGVEPEKEKKMYEPHIEVMRPERKEMPRFEPSREVVMETDWKAVAIFIGVIALVVTAIGFVWGVANNKFASSSSVSCPDIDIPSCNCPVCICPNTTLSCSPCVCPNVSSVCICPNVTVNQITNIYNQTNSTI